MFVVYASQEEIIITTLKHESRTLKEFFRGQNSNDQQLREKEKYVRHVATKSGALIIRSSLSLDTTSPSGFELYWDGK